MASTRNRNTPGDYAIETAAYTKQEKFTTKHQSVGEMYFPDNGLLGHKCPSHLLSNNSADVESFLFGIGSTNLVQPKGEVNAEMKTKKFLSIADRTPLIMPETFTVDSHQRPLFR